MDAEDNALATAREALRVAQEALRKAEEAASRTHAEITTKRINVVEDDGTLRMIIGNREISQELHLRGRQSSHPGRLPTAGILFLSDDGTECGGLTVSGSATGKS